MNLQREIERRIENKRQELADLEKRVGESKAYISALVGLLPKAVSGAKESSLRAGSDMAKARDLIKASGKPMHVTEILKGLGKDLTKGNRISLSGSLSGYARRGTIFTKTAPNTFGLIEQESEPQMQDLVDIETLRTMTK